MKKLNLILSLLITLSFFHLTNFAQSSADLQKAQEYINVGTEAYNRKDYPSAIENFTNAINLYSKSPELFFNRGTAYLHLRGFEFALKDFDKAIEMGKNLPKKRLAEFYTNRALALQGTDDYEKSIEDFNNAVSLNSEDVNLYLNRGNSYLLLKKEDLAIADYNKALEFSPHPIVYYNLARIYYGRRDFDQAIKNFTKSIDLHPQLPDSYIGRGICYEHKGNLNSALQDYTKAISLTEKNGVYHFNRGNIYFKKGNFDLAIDDYTKAIEIYPLWALALRNRAKSYKKLGHIEPANVDLQKANEVEKENFNPVNKTEYISPQ